MNKTTLTVATFLLACGFTLAQAPAGAHNFRGQIMDSMCATMGGHAPAGYEATHTHTPKDCTLACVKAGSTFVLYNTRTKTTYKLDNQSEPRALAGENVVIHGTLDLATKTIHVEKISPARRVRR
ncbi:MAG: DUF5818 domain-containing protein [Terriglobales bacterium]